MTSAFQSLLANVHIPAGVTIGVPDAESMRRVERAHDSATEADEAIFAVREEIRQRLVTSADGSITLTAADVAKLDALLTLISGRIGRVLDATTDLTVLAFYSGGEA